MTDGVSDQERAAEVNQLRAEVAALRAAAETHAATQGAEARYNALIDAANDVIYSHDFAGRFTWVNPAGARLYGYTSDEILQLNIRDIVDPDYLPVALANLRRKQETAERTGPYELLTRTKTGAAVWVEVSTAIVYRDTEPVGIQGVARDVTARKQAEIALQQSEAQLRATFDSANQMLVLLDLEMRIVAFNEYARRMVIDRFGGELTPGALMLDYVAPEDRAPFAMRIRGALAGEEQFGEREMRQPDGQTSWWEFYFAPIRDAGGAITGVSFTTREVTQRWASQLALQQSEANMRAILDSSDEAIMLVDPDGRLIACNKRLQESTLERFGRLPQIGESFIDLLLPSQREFGLSHFQLALAGAPVRREVEIRAPGPGAGWWETTYRPILLADGAVTGVSIVSADITERRRTAQALEDRERQYRQLVERAPVAIAIHRDGAFLYVNPAGRRLLGAPEDDELVGAPVLSFVHPDDAAVVSERMASAQYSGEEAPLVELKFLRRDGAPIDVEVISTPFLGGGPPAVQSVFQDVTRRKRFEQQMRLQATALGTAANAIMITDRNGLITWVNPAFTRLTGYTASEAIGQTARILKSGVQDAAYYEALWGAVLSGEIWQSEQVNRRKDGSLYTEEQTITPVRDESGQITHFVAIKQDVSERKQNEQRLSYLASHDTLTGLPNRHALERALEQAVARARRGPTGALLFLDLDNFKLVNDTLGHAAGDQLLVALSQVLMERLRDGDILARIGGDEFAVLLEHATLGEAREVAERLRDSVDSYRYQMAGRSFTLGVSIGLARIVGRHEPQTLLAQADTAMYTAKEGGRNRVAVYRPGESSLQGLSEANQWIPRIRDALRDDGLRLYYQPVFRLSDRSVSHHEALLRMTGPAGEIILPGEFIAAAERFGLMQPIDHWVVREAIRQLKRYPAARLVVNLSGHSRVDDDLMTLIETELRTHDVEPARLGFEITETAAVQDLARAEFWVRRLKDLGCQFALDDFGVGFTSFGYLRSLPVDQIKIDGSFIRNIDQDAGSRDIVLAMHSLARALGKETVAEAVENEAILAVLRDIGVTYVQGYYLGPPQPTLDRTPVAIA